MAEERAGCIDLTEGTLLARAWLIASDAQHIELLLPKHYTAGQMQEIFLRDPGFRAVVERMRGFEVRKAGKTRETQREILKQLQKCADWLMTAQGYVIDSRNDGVQEKLKECENETRTLIKELEEI